MKSPARSLDRKLSGVTAVRKASQAEEEKYQPFSGYGGGTCLVPDVAMFVVAVVVIVRIFAGVLFVIVVFMFIGVLLVVVIMLLVFVFTAVRCHVLHAKPLNRSSGHLIRLEVVVGVVVDAGCRGSLFKGDRQIVEESQVIGILRQNPAAGRWNPVAGCLA